MKLLTLLPLVLFALVGCEKHGSIAPAGSSVQVLPPRGPHEEIGAPDPDRRAAAWALSLGGSVAIEQDMKTKTVAAAADLPADSFKVVQLNLANKEQVDDGSLANLGGLTKLEALNLNRTKITNAGAAKLKELPSLKYLNLCVPELGDAAVEHLKGLPNLVSVELSYTGVTDAGLAHLKALANLETLYLAQTKVTDDGVADLRKASAKVVVKK